MIGGKKGSGKDAACSYLLSKYGGNIISFAAPLYDMMYYCQDRLSIPRFKDRAFLTKTGDHFRATNPDIFVDLTFEEANSYPEWTNVYISDGRYENELDGGKRNAFYMIEIVASDENRQTRRPGESIIDSHSSENGYPADYQFDIVISNNSTLEDLYKALDAFVETVVLKRRVNAID
jgi:hypothetical protein